LSGGFTVSDRLYSGAAEFWDHTGSNGSTKDKDERFVPIHPKVAELLGSPRNDRGPIYCEITQRTLLKRLKVLCEQCEFENPRQYKLHSFRHHFASLCANNRVAHRKALAWLGHSSSDMLDLYYHLHDEDSLQAMQALADEGADRHVAAESSEGNLRATGQSTIEKKAQAPEIQELVDALNGSTERAGFEPAVHLVGVRRFSKPVHSATLPPLRL